MDDDFNITTEFNVFSNNRYIRTYSKANRNTSNVTQNVKTLNKTTIPVIKNDPLTTKNAVQFLLDGTLKHKVCRYCLNVTSNLSELDQFLEVNGQGALYKVTIRDMVASFHPIKVADDPNLPDKICNKCLDRTISAYLFAQQCERAERALRNCIEDMYDKLIKLDPLERQKKRGRQKLNPNYNTLYAEHKKVIQYAEPLINIINTSSKTLTDEGPIKDYECLKCCQVLPTVDSLLNHEKSHPKSMWYNCRLCGKSFPKRYLLKKHANAHLVEKPPKPAENSFHCNTCGEVSKDCNEYLQHIEKHKFKQVMEHLVEKNMDELCSVCLDKSSNMTKLDSMVCLHGGHMDMAGDRSLYNILASTIPDPKLYKYQELVIPRKAHIMTIVKKDKKPPAPLTNLYFSNPIILTTDNSIFDEVYMFFFSLPLKVTSYIEKQEESKIYELPIESQVLDDLKVIDDVKSDSDMIELPDRNESHDLEVISDTIQLKVSSALDNKSQYDNLHDIKKICDEKVINNTNIDIHVERKQNFIFSKPIYLAINYEIPIVGEVTNELNEKEVFQDIKPKPCEVCWVFKDKTCEACKNNDEVIIKQIDSNSNETKPCNYCWLFKCVEKCENCKKPNKILDTAIENLNTKAVEKACNKNNICKDSNSPKAKSFEATTSKEFNNMKVNEIEKKPWKCSICLTTNNADKQKCFCCESEGNTKDSVKIKFGQYASLFNEVTKTPMELKSNVNTVKHMETPEKAMNVINNKKSDKTEVQDMDTEPIYNIIDSGKVNYKPQVPETLNLVENHFTMTPEYEKLVKNHIAPEKMDVEETVEDIARPNFNENKQVHTFEFQMGSVVSEDKCMRKIKRPFRKMSRASHK